MPRKLYVGPLSPLGRVVIHDVENDLDARLMEGFHHRAELVARICGSVAYSWCGAKKFKVMYPQ